MTESLWGGTSSETNTELGVVAFFDLTRTAHVMASAAEVLASYIDTLDMGRPTNSDTMVWNSHMACSMPWLTSGW